MTLYYLADFLADFPLVVCQALAFGLPLYLCSGMAFDASATQVVVYFACLVCLYLNGVAFATFVAHLCGTGATANLVMSSFLTFNIIFDGFLISLPRMAAGWRWAAFTNVLHFPHFALVANELRNRPLDCALTAPLTAVLAPDAPGLFARAHGQLITLHSETEIPSRSPLIAVLVRCACIFLTCRTQAWAPLRTNPQLVRLRSRSTPPTPHARHRRLPLAMATVMRLCSIPCVGASRVRTTAPV